MNNNALGRMQPRGVSACWFHGLLNGFLLAPRSRELLRARLEKYKQTNLANFMRSLGAVGNACPMPGRLNSGVFWAYVNSRLKNSSRNVNSTVSAYTLMRNVQLRKPNASQNRLNTGGWIDVDTFIAKLWPEYHTPNSPIIMLGYNPLFGEGVPAYMRLTPGNPEYRNNFIKRQGAGVYRASHAYISASWIDEKTKKKLGHAITGYIKMDGTQMAYDSNDERSFQCNWRTDWRCVANHIYKRYGKTYNISDPSLVSVDYSVVFIRTEGNNRVGNSNIEPSFPPNSTLPINNRHMKNYRRAIELNNMSQKHGNPRFRGRRIILGKRTRANHENV